MRVEILSLDEYSAKCRVTDDNYQADFTCGAGTAAHAALRLMIHNAVSTIAKMRAQEAMEQFASRECDWASK